MFDLTERLYNGLKAKTPRDQRNTYKMYPSSAGQVLSDGTVIGACAREQYYRWYKCKRSGEVDPEGQLIFETGDALHDMVTRMIRKTSATSDVEVLSVEQGVVYPDIFLSGRSDIVLLDKRSGEIHGCEVKTVGEGAIYTMKGKPKLEHILQSVVYLDRYTKNANETGTRPPNGWVLLYVARSESWKLKSYPHGSHFKYIWQYYITIDDNDDVIVQDQLGNLVDTKGLNVGKIFDRYNDILKQVKNKQLPDRDYEYQYDEVKLQAMRTANLLNKKDTELVDKWISDGAPQGKLQLDKGDYQCRYCNYADTCYSATPDIFDTEETPLIPLPPLSNDNEEGEKEETLTDTILF